MTRARGAVLGVLVLVLTVAGQAQTRTQGGTCRQVLATTVVAGGSYAVVTAKPFEGRIFAYAPAVPAAGTGFRPFQLWVIEGVYGQPFVRPSGPLTPADFEKLRRSPNVRAQALNVRRANGTETLSVRVGKSTYSLQVVGVSPARGGTVRIQACNS